MNRRASKRPSQIWLRLASVAIGLLVGLVVVEMSARLWTGAAPFGFLGPGRAASLERQGEPRARALLDRIPRATGIEARWFDDSPPAPPAQATNPIVHELAAWRPPRDVFTFEVYRVWNSAFVPIRGCDYFARLSPRLQVWDPPDGDSRPPFRYLPAATTPLGLTTNSLGWRGPEIPLDKPPRTIRLAFLGASTTVGQHAQPFSYPELVVGWLNHWAKARGLDVRFDGINAGREGISSDSIAAIVKRELLPMEADLYVYYEGANQFDAKTVVEEGAAAPPRTWVRPMTPLEQRVQALARKVAVADMLLPWVRRFTGRTREIDKPAHRLSISPALLDQPNPDPQTPGLPLNLPAILTSLEAIRGAVGAAGATLAVSSFVWLARDDLELDPVRQWGISLMLNRQLWPLTHAEVAQLAAFQNRVLREWARSAGLPFFDVAAAYPMDPDLFLDAIHMNAGGTRLHAWIVLQDVVAWLAPEIAAGRLPAPDRETLREHPSIGATRWIDNPCSTKAPGQAPW